MAPSAVGPHPLPPPLPPEQAQAPEGRAPAAVVDLTGDGMLEVSGGLPSVVVHREGSERVAFLPVSDADRPPSPEGLAPLLPVGPRANLLPFQREEALLALLGDHHQWFVSCAMPGAPAGTTFSHLLVPLFLMAADLMPQAFISQWELHIPVLLLNEVVQLLRDEGSGSSQWITRLRHWWFLEGQALGSFQEKWRAAYGLFFSSGQQEDIIRWNLHERPVDSYERDLVSLFQRVAYMLPYWVDDRGRPADSAAENSSVLGSQVSNLVESMCDSEVVLQIGICRALRYYNDVAVPFAAALETFPPLCASSSSRTLSPARALRQAIGFCTGCSENFDREELVPFHGSARGVELHGMCRDCLPQFIFSNCKAARSALCCPVCRAALDWEPPLGPARPAVPPGALRRRMRLAGAIGSGQDDIFEDRYYPNRA